MRKPSVLIIDDDHALLGSLFFLLEKEFDVYTASGGKEGLGIIKQHPVWLVLLDLCMPKMNGLEVLQIIRNKFSCLKVIIITGVIKHKWAAECADLNVQGYLEKPIDPLRLIERIKNMAGMAKYGFLEALWKEEYAVRISSISPVVDKCLQFIEENCHTNFTRYEMAAHFDLTPDYLNKLFHRECGIGFKDYINKVRIHKSQESLAKPFKVKIKDIAESIGFSDVVYFCRFFKKHTTLTPTEFRNIAFSVTNKNMKQKIQPSFASPNKLTMDLQEP